MKRTRKVLAILLSLAMTATMSAGPVWADSGNGTSASLQSVVDSSLDYQYDDNYTAQAAGGQVEITSAEGAVTLLGSYTSSQATASGDTTNPIVADMARILGALHRYDGSPVDSIAYGENTYTWNDEGDLKGSNWVTGDDKKTLVSAIVSSFSGKSTPYTCEIALKDDDTEIGRLTLKTVVDDSLSALEAAVSGATAGDTVKLLGDMNWKGSALEISKDITIDGDDYTVTGKADSTDAYFNVKSGTATFKNLTLNKFGNNIGSVNQYGVIKVPADASNAKVVADNVKFTKFNRAAIDVRNGDFEVTNCVIDCNNGQSSDKMQTKGIVAYQQAGDENAKTTGTVKNTSISGSNSFEGWSANGIEVSAGADVTIENCKITSQKGGVSVARNYGHGAANVTIKDSDIQGSNYALRIYEGSSSVKFIEGTSATITVDGGHYEGNIRIGVGSDCTAQESGSTITISSGYFTEKPDKEFIAEGKAAIVNQESNADTYKYVVTDGDVDNPEIASAAPEVAEVPGTGSDGQALTTEETELANSAKTALELTGDNAPAITGLESAAQAQANEITVTDAEAEQALAAVGVTTGSAITVFLQTYMNIAIKDVTVVDGQKTIKLDITPMYKTVATTATDASGINLDGGSRNAVELTGTGMSGELNVTGTTTVIVPLPANFAATDSAINVKHTHNDKNYIYSGKVKDVEAAGGGAAHQTLTFVNYNGYSEFEIGVANPAATIGEVGYETLQDAVDAAGTDDTIVLQKDGETASVSKTVKIKKNSHTATITAASGYRTSEGTADENGVTTYTTTRKSSSGGSGSGGSSSSKDTTTTTPETTTPEATTPEQTVTPAPSTSSRFIDVASDAWYKDAVDFVADKGIMNGTGDNKFSSEDNLTRGMLMTMLARYDGQDTSGGSVWYEKGMNWAKVQGISDGTNPEANITREQLVTMLYRYAGSPSVDTSVLNFGDSAAISDYAKSAVAWAVSKGIVNGMGDGTFAPQSGATRAQVAAIFQRYAELYSYNS